MRTGSDTTSAQPAPHPVAVHLNGNGHGAPVLSPAPPVPRAVGEPEGPAAAARIAVVVVTWNRRGDVARAVEALSRQTYPRELMDVVVVDNASTDGTLEHLRDTFRPDAVVQNATERAHEPAFAPAEKGAGPNLCGFRSLTVVRNTANLGGCGGFNTGFGFIERHLSPDFVWLADDDADFPPDALANLVRAAQSDERIGIVGSRTVSITDRATTIETTIYFDRRIGAMCDEPPPHHPQYESHRRWVAATGGHRGKRDFSGVRDVDIVSACSLLARWSAVQKVGYWDWRYFIYCDDADWCLRFAKAGYRVVLSLDAVVYHTPWLLKLTPARIYYSQRNAVWMLQKILPPRELRRVTRRWMRNLLRDALRAAVHRRLFHAEIIRATVRDVITGRAGRTGSDGPPALPLIEAFRRAGCLRPGARVALVCNHGDRGAAPLEWARQVRDTLRAELARAGGEGEAEPRWVEIVRNDVEAAALAEPAPAPEAAAPEARIVYGGHRLSRLRRQLDLLRVPPRAVVVFDQTNDYPALRGRWNIHVDMKKPGAAQLERDGPLPRAVFALRWLGTAARAAVFSCTVRPYTSPTKYG